MPEVSAPNWLRDFAMFCNVTEHVIQLNEKLQNRKQLISQMSNMITAFQNELDLWKFQVEQGSFVQFPVR